MIDVAIIGGGAAGAALFGELLRRPGCHGTVHWIVDRGVAGRGVAYSTPDALHLLNVRAAGMSLFADHEEEFLQYASLGLEQPRGTDFLPRRLFGEFVETQLRAVMGAARKRGARFHLHQARAIGVRRCLDHRYRVELAKGGALVVDAVVLAVGALEPRPMRGVSSEALGSGAYVLDPWNQGEPARPPRRVLLIGTGLTAVDTLISSSTRWPRAELIAISRHGVLPFNHSDAPVAAYSRQDALNHALLGSSGVAQMMHLIREALADAGMGWRAVIDGIRPITVTLWQGLTTAQRRQFLRHARWAWEAARHRTAPASYELVRALTESGRLHIRAARILAVDGRGPLAVTMRDRATRLMSTIEVDRVIQATGLDTTVSSTRDPLLAQLLGEGLVAPDPLQLGVAAAADGQLLDAGGQAQPGLYGIGVMLRGNFWECTAMPEIRIAASRLARTLTGRGGADDVQQIDGHNRSIGKDSSAET